MAASSGPRVVVPRQIAVIGPSEATPGLAEVATEVGHRLAESGAVLVCGGLGGVMEAACRGAVEAGGLTIGLLPGLDRSAANRWVSVPLATGLGELRNALVVRTADAVIAVGGEYGTLSEVALALQAGRPVVGLSTWSLVRGDGRADTGVMVEVDAAGAVKAALRLAELHGST